MKGPFSYFLVAAYGIAWAWGALHPYHAFFFLLFVGLLASVRVMAEGIVKALPFILLGILFSVLTALFPFLAIVETIFLAYMAYKKRRIIRSHVFLIIIGIVAYAILFYAPHDLAHGLLANARGGLMDWLLFGMGALLMVLMCYILRRMGYDERKTAMYIVGFPGFIFLIWCAWRDFPRGRRV